MTTRFDLDTAVEPQGDGRYTGRVERSWWIVRGPNGGYVAAIILRALVAEVGDAERTPRSLTVHYLAPPEEGPVDVLVTIERAGRSLSALSARLLQDGQTMAVAVAAFGRSRSAVAFADRTMPAVSPPGACERRSSDGEADPPALVHWDQRFAIGSALASGGPALSGGWIAPTEPRPLDHLLVTAMMDAWIPPIFCRVADGMGVPTVDLTLHFRTALPPNGLGDGDHVLGVFHSDVAAEGYVTEDGELWSSGGVLLAESRQLALLV